jgi:hypothetical protein
MLAKKDWPEEKALLFASSAITPSILSKLAPEKKTGLLMNFHQRWF